MLHARPAPPRWAHRRAATARSRAAVARVPRAARAAVAGTTVTAASLAAHSLGGAPVHAEAVPLLLVLLTAAAAALADRELGFGRLLLLVLAAQAAVHLTASVIGGHAVGAPPSAHGAPGMGHGSHALSGAAAPAPLMVAVHAAVAVGLAVLLRLGESVVLRLLVLLGAALGGPVLPAGPITAAPRPVTNSTASPLRRRLLEHRPRWRGPPLAAAG